MLRITEARHIEGYKVFLRYENGLEGVIDFSDHSHHGMFAPWKDINYFRNFTVPADMPMTLEWPNEADIAPEFLYSRITGIPQEHAFAAMMAVAPAKNSEA